MNAVAQWTNADVAIRVGVDELTARSFLQPEGILTRMRALACGWVNPGDKMKSASDASWWRAVYAFPLWNPLGTYVDRITPVLNRTGGAALGLFDDKAAQGDSAALSVMLGDMNAEISELLEAPCPEWLVPPGKGQLPIPNPDCAERKERKRREDLKRERERKRDDRNADRRQDGVDYLIFFGVIALIYYAGKKALR